MIFQYFLECSARGDNDQFLLLCARAGAEAGRQGECPATGENLPPMHAKSRHLCTPFFAMSNATYIT